MKIDTKDLNNQMHDLVECLEAYFADLDVKRSELDEFNKAAVDIIDSILGRDESNLLWITYGDKVNDLHAKVWVLQTLVDDIQELTSDLSSQIRQDSERLKL
ncbi:hypothetical protein [Ligilactobacillus agilis]|uniref:hypothetical protein n=1 Tax=Ligilactobacillus agilis TaxID=1601 RepID=UPI00067F040F|nr:hypothetical protein [Ligilactobacillus agilis]